MIAVDVCRTPVPALPSYPPQHPLCQFRWVSTRLVYDGVRAQAQQQPLHMFTQQILRSSRRTACPVHSLRTPSGVLLGAQSQWRALPLPVPSLTVVATPAVASGLTHIVLCRNQQSLWFCSCAARRLTAWHGAVAQAVIVRALVGLCCNTLSFHPLLTHLLVHSHHPTDPAAEAFNYPVSIDIRDLISLEDVMTELELGPNG